MDAKVAVLGLGAMGARMAKRLLDAGCAVTVWNRTEARAQDLVAAGATWAPTPRAAADGQQVVICMVRDDDASRAVWLHPETGALAGLGPDAVALESSTLTPAWVEELARAHQAHDRAFLDVPVAGSRPQAEAGQLVYLVGGPEATLARVREVLGVMGGAVHHVGPVGAGTRLKLAVNALFGIQVAALGEALALLEKGGIGRAQAMAALGDMPVTSPALKGVGGLIAAGQFAPLFPIDLVEKDFGYVLAAAEAAGVECPTAAAVRDVYTRAQRDGWGDENIAAVAKVFLR